MAALYSWPTHIPQALFRNYDIRGQVNETALNESFAYALGRALGAEAFVHNQSQVVVGWDGRLSSPSLSQALIQGLLEAGQNVIAIGQVATPMLYFATHTLTTKTGVMVTGSHNPKGYNGFKIVVNGQCLSGDTIQALYLRMVQQDISSGSGQLMKASVTQDYQDAVVHRMRCRRPMKVVVDPGNGAGSGVASTILRQMGCHVVAIYDEVEGQFPNHHPDPAQPENLKDLIAKVKATGADCGIALDGDADRCGLVTDQGTIVWPDRQLMLLSIDLLSRHRGAQILFDVKCTSQLAEVITAHGGEPVMWKTGHSLLKAKMKETQALLAGEMSGHHFFAENWYGFDDGIYAAAKLVQILSMQSDSCEAVFAALPSMQSTPELKVPMADAHKFDFLDRFIAQAQFPDAKCSTLDGLRVTWPDGWGLLRASNTTPCLVLRFEAKTQERLEALVHLFCKQMLRVEPSLDVSSLPYRGS